MLQHKKTSITTSTLKTNENESDPEANSLKKERENNMDINKKYIYTHNNSSDYYKQTNNERDPYITCFNTSMINVALDIMKIKAPDGNDKTGGFKQPEDQFDWYMHNSPEVKKWVDDYCKTPWVADYLKTGGDIRELWEVEAYCFNKWIGNIACRINYNMKRRDFIEEIQRGRGVVTTGKFCRFAHAVSVVGFVAEVDNNGFISKDITFKGDNISIPINEDSKEVKEIIIDDSYGDPRNKYAPVGVGGNDVHLQKEEFFTAINKGSNSNEQFYGIIFDLV